MAQAVVLCGAALAVGACQQDNQPDSGAGRATSAEGVLPGTPATAPAVSSAPSSAPSSPSSTAATTTAVRTVFDRQRMQTAVWRMLVDQYDIDDVQAVSCPPGQEVVDGNTFHCTAMIAGRQVKVLITVKGDEGRYVVSRPDLGPAQND